MGAAFKPLGLLTLALVMSVCVHSPLQAQTVFRSVSPSGRVIFSDRPSNEALSTIISMPGAAVIASNLPFELQKIADQYPVVLYSTERCPACDAARALLNGRGIPFAEKLVRSAQDTQALQRLTADTALPLLTIGKQQLKGYADIEWTQYLDAAGYPKTSMLPPGYRQPAATPLVGTSSTAAPTSTSPIRITPSIAAPDASQNPAGIRF